MVVHTFQSSVSRKKRSSRQPPCQNLVEAYNTGLPRRTSLDPLDKVRTQAYRDAVRAAHFGVEKVYEAEDFVQKLDKNSPEVRWAP
jgi:hypothetical protein